MWSAAGGVEHDHVVAAELAASDMRALAMAVGCWPLTIGSVSTPICSPSTELLLAAGRRVSSEAISTFFLLALLRRLAILAVVVVLPEPCRPTIRIGDRRRRP
jgi:hypothetical protein